MWRVIDNYIEYAIAKRHHAIVTDDVRSMLSLNVEADNMTVAAAPEASKVDVSVEDLFRRSLWVEAKQLLNQLRIFTLPY